MDDRYFHAKRHGLQVETTGTPSCLLGHQIDLGESRKLDGIFAHWSWDGERLRVHNDRYGFFPIFYFFKEGEIGVSPSIRRLIKEGAPTDLDETGLAVFLRLGFFIGGDTPYKHIRTLPPNATLEWDGTVKLLAGGDYSLGRQDSTISRDDAIEKYIVLFRQSIERRPPPSKHFAVPISGGRDSRHILLELLHQGHRPERCVTIKHYPPRSNEDARVAAEVTRELGLPHVLLDQKEPWFKAEYRKNFITNFCSDEHTWYIAVSDYLATNFEVVYDGIAGDVLSAGLFVNPKRLELLKSCDVKSFANELLQDRNEETLRALLTPRMYVRCSRESAVSHLQAEIEKHLPSSNPIGSFFFWNRTRREIALVPYGLLGSLPKVFSPYLDHDLFDFLVSLPTAMLADHAFHSDTILRAYPRYSHIPYEGKAPLQSDQRELKEHFLLNARFGRDFAKYLLFTKPSGLMRNGFLFPRSLAGLLNRKMSASATWYAPMALYLHQLDSLSKLQ